MTASLSLCRHDDFFYIVSLVFSFIISVSELAYRDKCPSLQPAEQLTLLITEVQFFSGEEGPEQESKECLLN